MTSLPNLQQEFQSAVLARKEQPGLFVPKQGEGGFGIYASAYRARLTAALRDNYPVLVLALGDEMFDALAETYIEQQPSSFRSIRWFGDRLAEFMDAHEDLTPHPSLSDLARMDWALRQGFDAANDDALSVEKLAALQPEDWPLQRFYLRMPVALYQLDWHIEPIWRALSRDAEAETEPPEAGRHTLLVWRNSLDCQWRSLDIAEAAGLELLAEGKPFAEICEGMMSTDAAMTPTSAAIYLRRWVEEGLLKNGGVNTSRSE